MLLLCRILLQHWGQLAWADPGPNCLQLADPEDACEPLSKPDTGSAYWIALIVRSEALQTNCSFDVKVWHCPGQDGSGCQQPVQNKQPKSRKPFLA